jgi:type IV secretory pathway TrbL component
LRFLLPAGLQKFAVSVQFYLASLPAVTLLHLGKASELALLSTSVMLQNPLAVV